MYLDIHSHILSGIDDGADDLAVSKALLENISLQGITHIIATPHFYPLFDSLEDFIENRQKSLCELQEYLNGDNYPNIYLGCEVLYFSGISYASGLHNLTLANTNYILLEPDYSLLNNKFQCEILHLKELGFIPIIAHIERYHKARGFKKFFEFVKDNKILTQANATSFFSRSYNRILKKLIKENIITFIASDTHSLDARPPMVKKALDKVSELFGENYAEYFTSNSQKLLTEILNKEHGE